MVLVGVVEHAVGRCAVPLGTCGAFLELMVVEVEQQEEPSWPSTSTNPALLRALGETITTRREELGLSQRALGLEAGVERNMLRGVEDRSRRATIITLARIAEALKVPLSQILHQIGH